MHFASLYLWPLCVPCLCHPGHLYVFLYVSMCRGDSGRRERKFRFIFSSQCQHYLHTRYFVMNCYLLGDVELKLCKPFNLPFLLISLGIEFQSSRPGQPHPNIFLILWCKMSRHWCLIVDKLRPSSNDSKLYLCSNVLVFSRRFSVATAHMPHCIKMTWQHCDRMSNILLVPVERICHICMIILTRPSLGSPFFPLVPTSTRWNVVFQSIRAC